MWGGERGTGLGKVLKLGFELMPIAQWHGTLPTRLLVPTFMIYLFIFYLLPVILV